MDEREPIRVVREDDIQGRGSRSTPWLAAGIIVLVIALGLTVGYIYQQQNNSKQLMSRDSEMGSTISQMQDKIDALSSKLNQAVAPAAVPAPAASPSQPGTTSATSKRQAASTNKRFKAMQAALDDEQKQLKDTQDQVAQARSDLEAGLNSTRDDLNGSIARTHDELVSLEQRGERTYFEFDLTRAKHFQKEGPLMVSLRKVDAKHGRYDLAMVVNDNHLSKKNVNLYEPIWIDGTDRQQVQLVVNSVGKDHVHGYVSAPKFVQTASITNVSAHPDSSAAADVSATPTSNGNTDTPEQPQQTQPQQ